MGFDSVSASTKPTQIPTQEEDPSSPCASLLSFNTAPHHKNTATSVIFSSLILVACIALSAASAFALLLFSSSSAPRTGASFASLQTTSRPLTKLNRPVVLLISSDGFRFGYQFKTHTPNIHRLIANGTEAETGLIPVFPSLTFPNHYSIVTGLYPAYHGIINNHFDDPKTGEAAAYFWAGSEVHKGSWTCPQDFCMVYNGSVPFDERVDTVLSYFDLPTKINEAVAGIDRMIGKLIDGLEKRGVFDDVTIIMVGDHGMVGTCDKKLIFLDDLAPWIDIPADWVQSYTPLLAIRPPPGFAPSDVVAKMNEGLQSGKVQNGKNLKMYLKEKLPSRLHYAASARIPPIIGMVDEGYTVEQKGTKRQECGGAHGYDNALFSMRTIFIGHGPQFARGRKVPSFENVQIYNLVTSILNIQGAPNNGSVSFPSAVLLPDPHKF
ncbi:ECTONUCLEOTIDE PYROPHOSPHATASE/PHOSPHODIESTERASE [Salix purpurea]|uniref:ECTONUCLEOTIDE PYROPHOSPHATASE/PHOSPHODIESTERASE n=1 Tax=Salix purpurea TaxID=77065 RepID=A0A9Q0UK71_SALPP|nr:ECTONUCLEOTIDE PYROPHOSPHATASE/PHOSPHODIESTERASE [Salix purpurea]